MFDDFVPYLIFDTGKKGKQVNTPSQLLLLILMQQKLVRISRNVCREVTSDERMSQRLQCVISFTLTCFAQILDEVNCVSNSRVMLSELTKRRTLEKSKKLSPIS